jgi:O-antigen ligase
MGPVDVRVGNASSPDAGRLARVWAWWLAALFSVPFVLPYRTLPRANHFHDALACGLVALALAAIAAQRLRAGDRRVYVASIAWTPLLLGGVLVVQQLRGQIAYVQHFVLPFGALLLAAGAASLSHERLRPAAAHALQVVSGALVAAGCLNAAFVALQLAGYEFRGFVLTSHASGLARASGLLSQPNQLAVLLTWSLLGLLYLHLRGRMRNVPALLLAACLVAALLLTRSRATYVYVAAVAPLLALALRRALVKRWWLPIAVAVCYLLLDLGLRLLLPALDPAGASQLIRPLDGSSTMARLAFIRDGWALFLSAPLLGVGWHNFASARWSLPTAIPLEFNALHAHNVVINLLVEVGATGFAIVALGVGLWAFRAVRAPLTIERAIAFALVAVVALYSLFEFPLWLANFLMPTAVLVGLLEVRATTFAVSGAFNGLRAASALALPVFVAAVMLDYARVESVYRASFVPALRPPTLQDVLRTANTTLYREEAEQIYLLGAPVDALHATLAAQMSERVFAGFPAPQFAVVRAAHLVYNGDEKKAAHILGRMCRSLPDSCDFIQRRFTRLARDNGEPFASFAAGPLPEALRAAGAGVSRP